MPRSRSTKRKKESLSFPIKYVGTAKAESLNPTTPFGISTSGLRPTITDCPTWTGIPPSNNPAVNDLVRELLDLHNQKNHDYASEADPFSNFAYAAQFAGVTVDTVFKVLMGVKWARLKELQNKLQPRNESVQDTRQDLALYTLLWAAYSKLPPF